MTKLLKYDFKNTLLTFAVIFLVCIIGVIASMEKHFLAHQTYMSMQFALLILGIGAVALTLGTIVFLAGEFERELYGRRGYLVWTLPVNSSHILISKFLIACIWSFCCSIMLWIVIDRMAEANYLMQESLHQIFSDTEISDKIAIPAIVEFVPLAWLSLFLSVSRAYCCLSIAHSIARGKKCVFLAVILFLLFVYAEGMITVKMTTKFLFGWETIETTIAYMQMAASALVYLAATLFLRKKRFDLV